MAWTVRVQEEFSKQDSVKYLGVEIDKDLNWKNHIDGVIQRCLVKFGIIRRASGYVRYNFRGLLYLSFVHPNLDYCSAVWHTCRPILTKQLTIWNQSYALQMILEQPSRTSSEPPKQKLGTTLNTDNVVYQIRTSKSIKHLHTNLSGITHLGYSTTWGVNKLHLKQAHTCRHEIMEGSLSWQL